MTDDTTAAVPEEQEHTPDHGLSQAAGAAIAAAMLALWMLILTMVIVLFRALQAMFMLVRFAVPVLVTAAAIYASIELFVITAQVYGGDLPALVLALAAVVVVPAFFLTASQKTWYALGAVAILDVLATMGLQRAPPVVLALVPCILLAAVTFYFNFRPDRPEPQQEQGEPKNEEQQWSINPAMATVSSPSSLHSDPDV